MPRICRCGRIVPDRCECQYKHQAKRNVTMEGHGYDHRKASERYRCERPLCERCVMIYGVINASPSRDLHHIVSIRDAPHLRMDRDNWLALCTSCHAAIEGDVTEGLKVKQWSEGSYYALVGD